MTETGPCLVEVNSRCHGAAGSWMPLARALTGYTQAALGRARKNSNQMKVDPIWEEMMFDRFLDERYICF